MLASIFATQQIHFYRIRGRREAWEIKTAGLTTRNKTLFPAVFESASEVTTKLKRSNVTEWKSCQTHTNRETNVEQLGQTFQRKSSHLSGDFEKFSPEKMHIQAPSFYWIIKADYPEMLASPKFYLYI